MADNKSLRALYIPESTALHHAIARCEDREHAQWRDYGGRGITVCDEFRDPVNGFAAFLAEIGPRPGRGRSLDRIDGSLGYQHGNIRWADQATQAGNRRKPSTQCRDLGWGVLTVLKTDRRGSTVRRKHALLTADGVTMSIDDWAKLTGLAAHTIRQRIDRGWSPERAVEPVLFLPNSDRSRPLTGGRR